MSRYILRRLAITVPVLFGISLATYGMISFAPGDPVTAMLNPEMMATLGPGWIEQKKESLGLNKPLPVRYLLWLKEVSRGNLGYSYRDGQPVEKLILHRVWPTVKLMLIVMTIGILVGIPIGLLAALKQYSLFDYVTSLFGFSAVSVPSFFLALVLIYVFALRLNWLPTSGMNTVGEPPRALDTARHIVLPALSLGLAQAAPLMRYARSSMLESIRQDYIVVARAKGLRERTIVTRHALQNVLIPLVTVIALDLLALFGGTVIIEQVFSWPGMGTLAITSVTARDYPVIMGVTLIGGTMIVLSSLIADIVYAIVDPRIKYS